MIHTPTNNKTFRRLEYQIEDVVQRAVSDRVIGLSVSDVCRAANISRQTFYKHYSSVSDVCKRQEQRLQAEFKSRIGTIANREVLFTIMLTFIRDNVRYFSAMIDYENLGFLTWMVDYMRPRLALNNVADHAYLTYRGNLRSIFQTWVIHSEHMKLYLPVYTSELMRTRIVWSRLDHLSSFPQSAIHPAQP